MKPGDDFLAEVTALFEVHGADAIKVEALGHVLFAVVGGKGKASGSQGSGEPRAFRARLDALACAKAGQGGVFSPKLPISRWRLYPDQPIGRRGRCSWGKRRQGPEPVRGQGQAVRLAGAECAFRKAQIGLEKGAHGSNQRLMEPKGESLRRAPGQEGREHLALAIA